MIMYVGELIYLAIQIRRKISENFLFSVCNCLGFDELIIDKGRSSTFFHYNYDTELHITLPYL